jgi:hypothetical protein
VSGDLEKKSMDEVDKKVKIELSYMKQEMSYMKYEKSFMKQITVYPVLIRQLWRLT